MIEVVALGELLIDFASKGADSKGYPLICVPSMVMKLSLGVSLTTVLSGAELFSFVSCFLPVQADITPVDNINIKSISVLSFLVCIIKQYDVIYFCEYKKKRARNIKLA